MLNFDWTFTELSVCYPNIFSLMFYFTLELFYFVLNLALYSVPLMFIFHLVIRFLDFYLGFGFYYCRSCLRLLRLLTFLYLAVTLTSTTRFYAYHSCYHYYRSCSCYYYYYCYFQHCRYSALGALGKVKCIPYKPLQRCFLAYMIGTPDFISGLGARVSWDLDLD